MNEKSESRTVRTFPHSYANLEGVCHTGRPRRYEQSSATPRVTALAARPA